MLKNKPKILFADIETSPTKAWVWSTGKQYVGHEQILEDSRIICISYKWDGEDTLYSKTWSRDGKQSDKALVNWFGKAAAKADLIIGHNFQNFDLRHVSARIAFHGLPPLPLVTIQDTLKDSRRTFRLASHSLAYMCKYFKVGAKTKHRGIDLWLETWLHHDADALAEMVEYCENDVVILEHLYDRIKPYLKTKLNLSVFNDRPCCPSCGSNTLRKNSIKITTLGKKQQYQCSTCGKFHTDGKNLLTTKSSELLR